MKTAESKTTTTAANTAAKIPTAAFFSQEPQRGMAFFGGEAAEAAPFFSPRTIQPKLTIGKPNDQYEQQADAVADQVVAKQNTPPTPKGSTIAAPTPKGSRSLPSGVGGTVVQTKCDHCEQEENLQKKELLSLDNTIQKQEELRERPPIVPERFRDRQDSEEGETRINPAELTYSTPTAETTIACNPTPLTRAAFLAVRPQGINELGLTTISIHAALVSPTTLQFNRLSRGRVSLQPLQITPPRVSSICVQAGNFMEGTSEVLGQDGMSCPSRFYPKRWEITQGAADKIREAELEHCQDYNRAFALSVLSLANTVNTLANPQPPTGTVRTFVNEAVARRQIQTTIGFNPDDWFNVLNCLTRKSQLRDTRNWHIPSGFRQLTPTRPDCSFVRIILRDSNFPHVGQTPATTLITLAGCP